MATTAELGRRLVLAVVSLLLLVGTAYLPPPRASADEPAKVLLLLDVSGSMNDKIASGGSKFTAAKKALKRVAGALPSGTQVGLRVYGSTIAEPKSQNPKACTDTQAVLPVGPLDRSRMDRAVDSFTAKGETPIAYALGQAVHDLGTSGKRVLILISDGEESCSGDPCPVARELAESGVDLQFNAIGLDVNAKARKQLQCIADAGDGSYLDAGDTGALEDALRKLTQRALRPFEVSGRPVKGTRDPEQAPTIGVGQYRDRYDTSNKPRHYTIDRTPGSVVTASIGSVVKPFRDMTADRWLLELTTLDGEVCAKTETSTLTFRVSTVFGGAVRSAYAPGPEPTAAPGCADDPQLRWSLARSSATRAANAVPVELLVSEEPQPTNGAALPEGLDHYDGEAAKAVAAKKPAQPVVGGSAYSNAPLVGAGTWSDTAAIGETVVYRVPLDYGQRLRVTATAEPGDAGLTSGEAVTTHVNLMSPARLRLTTAYQNAALDSPARVTVASPQVRVRNHEVPLPITANAADEWSTASVAGDYFVAVQLDPIQRYLIGRVMPLRLDIAVDGKPTGQPEYASTAPTPSTPATPSPSPTGATATPAPSTTPATPSAAPGSGTDPGSGSSGSQTFLRGLGSGLGVALVLAVAVWAVHRRRSRP